MRKLAILMGCVVIATACHDDIGILEPSGDTMLVLDDVGSDDTTATPPDTVTSPDAVATDVDAVPEPGACEPGSGCFGEPCDETDDCLSGICTHHMGDRVCSKTCDSACPAGWSCTLVGSGGSDGAYVCLSNYSHLCLPCEEAAGCTGQDPNACVRYPDGLSFCGGACDLETPCPSGYSCQQVETTSGAPSYQCVATSGVCLCSNLAIASALSTPCVTSNNHGTCAGSRVCANDGLTACDALEPAPEV